MCSLEGGTSTARAEYAGVYMSLQPSQDNQATADSHWNHWSPAVLSTCVHAPVSQSNSRTVSYSREICTPYHHCASYNADDYSVMAAQYASRDSLKTEQQLYMM